MLNMVYDKEVAMTGIWFAQAGLCLGIFERQCGPVRLGPHSRT